MQAKDIPDYQFLKWVEEQEPHWGFWHKFAELHPEYTGKVVLAKFRQLLKSDKVTGCGCGCRGDIELTEKGRNIIRKGMGV